MIWLVGFVVMPGAMWQGLSVFAKHAAHGIRNLAQGRVTFHGSQYKGQQVFGSLCRVAQPRECILHRLVISAGPQ